MIAIGNIERRRSVMNNSWDYWSRYNPKRWDPLKPISDEQIYSNYNGIGGIGAEGRSIIRTYKSIIGTTKHRFDSKEVA